MKTILKKKWDSICFNFYGNTLYKDVTFEILFQNYFYDEYRHYHNTSHLKGCLEYLDEIKEYEDFVPEKEPNYIVIELAIWFHDFIYDTRKNNNEELSALAAKQFILGCGENYSLANDVEKLILFTKYNREPVTIEEMILSDIDLSILGGYFGEYEDYRDNIRKEYYWAPDFVYYAGRLKVLEKFVNTQIYYTKYFIDNKDFGGSMEDNADENILAEIKYIKELLA